MGIVPPIVGTDVRVSSWSMAKLQAAWFHIQRGKLTDADFVARVRAEILAREYAAKVCR